MEEPPFSFKPPKKRCSIHITRKKKRIIQVIMVFFIVILMMVMVGESYALGESILRIKYHYLLWLFYGQIISSCNVSVMASWHPLPSALTHYLSIFLLLLAIVSWIAAMPVIIFPSLDEEILQSESIRIAVVFWSILIGICLIGLLTTQLIFFFSKRKHNYFTLNSAFSRQIGSIAYFAAELLMRTRMFIYISYQPRWLSEMGVSSLWLVVPPVASFSTVIAVFNSTPSIALSKLAMSGSVLGFLCASIWPIVASVRLATDVNFLSEYRGSPTTVTDYVLGMYMFAIIQIPLMIVAAFELKRSKDGIVHKDISFEDLALIDDIEIKGKIGAGNFAEVYKGIWQNSVVVALKKLKNTDQALDFLKEATVLQNLNHPHVIRFFGVYVSNIGDKYIVTEFANKGSLLTLIQKEGPNFTISDMLMMLKQACLGMTYLEKQRVLHRDLSLRNLLVDNFNNRYSVKIADLGLGRQSFEEIYVPTHKENEMLPVRWSSPEVIQWLVFTNKSDVWSFGVTMWEIFTNGERPYTDMSNKQVIAHVIQGGHLTKPHGCPDQVFNLMIKCWEFNANKRPDFTQLLEELTQVIEAFPPPKAVFSDTSDAKATPMVRSEELVEEQSAQNSKTKDLGYTEKFTYDKSPTQSAEDIELSDRKSEEKEIKPRTNSISSSMYGVVD